MTILITVAEIVGPVFLVAAAGAAWVRLGFEYRVEFVTRLAMTLSVPCLIFIALTEAEIDPGALRQVALAATMAYVGLAAILWAILTVARLDLRTWLAPMVFGNTGNLGLPLALLAFGNVGLGYAVVVFAITGFLSFTLGLWVVAGGGSPLKALREPLVGATLLGALFLWQGWQLPRVLANSVELVGQMAIPLMLLTLGVAMARIRARRIGFALVLALTKLAVCLLTGWVVARAFGLEQVAASVLILQLSTPVAVTSYLLAEKYGADSDSVAGLVVVSTFLSLVSLPLLLGALI